MAKNIIWGLVALTFVLVIGVLGLVAILSQTGINLAGLNFGLQQKTITVSGIATTQQTSQMANFNAGVTANNEDKQTAVTEVNTKMEEIISALKEFGIPDTDIKTQSISVNQVEEPYLPIEKRVSDMKKYWYASNHITIKLREIDRAGEMSQLLTSTGATNVYGPNFSLDDQTDNDLNLLGEAVADAKKKAEPVAKSMGMKLGKTVAIVEGGTSSPELYKYATMDSGMGGGAVPVEPGTNTVTQSVTVTFELK